MEIIVAHALYSCVPRSHSPESRPQAVDTIWGSFATFWLLRRRPAPLGTHVNAGLRDWDGMLLVAVKHKSFKMFAHTKQVTLGRDACTTGTVRSRNMPSR